MILDMYRERQLTESHTVHHIQALKQKEVKTDSDTIERVYSAT